MPTIKRTLRQTALLFGGWTVVGLIFAAVSYGIAMSEGSRSFGLAEALKLNLVQFYLWGIFSLLVFAFSRRFPVEFRPWKAVWFRDALIFLLMETISRFEIKLSRCARFRRY